MNCRPSIKGKQESREMERVAGVIEVSLNYDTHEIVIRHPGLRADVDGSHEIAIMPRYARHLAHLLMEYAATAEAEISDQEKLHEEQEMVWRFIRGEHR